MLSKLQEYTKKHKPIYDRPELNSLPLIINGYGGPGSGKSTTCLHLVAELKKLGYNAEYVSEYAKELVYEENYELLDGKVEHQAVILLEQNRRVERLVKNVDFIVSDSPILLSEIYVKERNTIFDMCVDELNSHYPAFSFFVERDNERFQEEGRIHNFEESKAKDREIKELLKNKEIYYGTYNHKTIDKIIPNCIKTWDRINREVEMKRNMTVVREVRKKFNECKKYVLEGRLDVIPYIESGSAKRNKMMMKLRNCLYRDLKSDYELGIISQEDYEVEMKALEMLEKAINISEII